MNGMPILFYLYIISFFSTFNHYAASPKAYIIHNLNINEKKNAFCFFNTLNAQTECWNW